MGASFESTRRHGKYLFASISAGSSLILHFGMTGFLLYFKGEADREGAAHSQVVVRFDNSYRLAYNSRRKLGMVGMTDDPQDFIEEGNLMELYDQLHILGMVALSRVLGALIGQGREFAEKPARMRTHMLVRGSAALLLTLPDILLVQFTQIAGST